MKNKLTQIKVKCFVFRSAIDSIIVLCKQLKDEIDLFEKKMLEDKKCKTQSH